MHTEHSGIFVSADFVTLLKLNRNVRHMSGVFSLVSTIIRAVCVQVHENVSLNWHILFLISYGWHKKWSFPTRKFSLP